MLPCVRNRCVLGYALHISFTFWLIYSSSASPFIPVRMKSKAQITLLSIPCSCKQNPNKVDVSNSPCARISFSSVEQKGSILYFHIAWKQSRMPRMASCLIVSFVSISLAKSMNWNSSRVILSCASSMFRLKKLAATSPKCLVTSLGADSTTILDVLS